MIGVAPIAGLLITLMQITDPVLTPQVFNHWYEDIHIPEALNAGTTNLVLRYTNYTVGAPEVNASALYSTQYLTLWKLPSIFNWNDTELRKKAPVYSPLFPDGGKEQKPVFTWANLQSSTWLPVQRFEGKSGRNDTPKFAMVVKIEPAQGGDDDMDQWYRQQHLDMLSMLPYYRRSTRYKTDNGSAPRFMAVHEMDDVNIDARTMEVLIGTTWAQRVMQSAKFLEVSYWKLSRRAGDKGEQL